MSRVVALPGDPEWLWDDVAVASMMVAVVDFSRIAEVETFDAAAVIAAVAVVARTSLLAVAAGMN